MFADAETRVAPVPRFEHPLIDRRTAPAVGAGALPARLAQIAMMGELYRDAGFEEVAQHVEYD